MPAIVALSLKVAPTTPAGGVCVVSIPGEAWPITTGSSAQPLVASLLLRSEERRVGKEWVPGWVGLEPAGEEWSAVPDTATGPSEATRPPSLLEQVLLS